MYPTGTFRVRLLDATNLNENHQHAILISALRACAALQVLAVHLRGEFFPGLSTLSDPTLWYQGFAFVTGFGHLAVMIFFVLSGWLVGGSLLNKLGEPHLLASYAIDRLTRLWIVLIPAFLLTLMLAMLTQTVDPRRISHAPDNEYSLTVFLGNLVGLQTMAVPRFGGNFALWSLANETWYYILFPLLLLPLIGKSMFTKTAGLVAGTFIAYHLLLDVVLYFVVWLLGVAFSRVHIELPRASRLALIILLVAYSVFYRLGGSLGTPLPRTFAEDVLFSLIFACLLSCLQFPADRSLLRNRLAIAIGRLAPFSFTLYVVHYPIILMLKRLDGPLAVEQLSTTDPSALLVYGALFTGIVVVAYLFYLPFEAQTYRVRRFLKRVALEGVPGRYSTQ